MNSEFTKTETASFSLTHEEIKIAILNYARYKLNSLTGVPGTSRTPPARRPDIEYLNEMTIEDVSIRREEHYDDDDYCLEYVAEISRSWNR